MNNKMMKKKMNKTNKRLISFATATVLFMGNLPLSEISDTVRKISDYFFSPINASAYVKYDVSDYTKTKTIGTTKYVFIEEWKDLENYSKAYYESSQGAYGSDKKYEHQNDKIWVGIGSGELSTYNLSGNYEPIGNDDVPFNGSISFESGSPSTFNVDCPVFGTIYENVTITTNNGVTPKEITITRTADRAGNPLFANKVKSDNDSSTSSAWKITFDVFSSTTDISYSGAIGEIEDGANVALSMVNNAQQGRSNIKSNEDVGAICGIIGEGATLTASYSGTNEDYTIISYNGNAGGLVGSMETGSTFNIIAAANLQKTADTLVQAGGDYAGGIIGKNDGGIVTLNDSAAIAAFNDLMAPVVSLNSFLNSAKFNAQTINNEGVDDNSSDFDYLENDSSVAEDTANSSSDLEEVSNDSSREQMIGSTIEDNTSTADSTDNIKISEADISKEDYDKQTEESNGDFEDSKYDSNSSLNENDEYFTESTEELREDEDDDTIVYYSERLLNSAAPTTYSIKQFIIGTKGVGGLFGYYKPSTTVELDVSK